MLEGADLGDTTWGEIYTEPLLSLTVESLWCSHQSKRQVEVKFWGGMDGRQARPLDPAKSAGAKDDRTVHRPAGARGKGPLRRVVVRLRYPGGRGDPAFSDPAFHQ